MSRIERCVDLYLLPCLVFVAHKCRDFKIRNGAMELYETMTDGTEDEQLRLLSSLVKLEEFRRTEDGRIPATARYIWSSAVCMKRSQH
jgi:hypothetical protein